MIIYSGVRLTITVTPITLSSFENAPDYSPETRDCLLENEMSPSMGEDTIFKKYSLTTCLLECRLVELMELFQCIPWDLILLQTKENRYGYKGILFCVHDYIVFLKIMQWFQLPKVQEFSFQTFKLYSVQQMHGGL